MSDQPEEYEKPSLYRGGGAGPEDKGCVWCQRMSEGQVACRGGFGCLCVWMPKVDIANITPRTFVPDALTYLCLDN